jgi:hypothetical protein
MIGDVKERINKFKYYLRQCDICDNIYKAYSKNGRRPKGKLCLECKSIVNKNRLAKIIKTKLRIKEIREHELHKLDS